MCKRGFPSSKVAPCCRRAQGASDDSEWKKQCGPISQSTDRKTIFEEQSPNLVFSESVRGHHRFVMSAAEETESWDVNEQQSTWPQSAVHFAHCAGNVLDPLVVKNAR